MVGGQLIAIVAVHGFQADDVLRAQAGDGAFDGGGAGGALADVASEIVSEAGVFWLRHEGERLRDALVGEQVQERGLFQLRREALAKRAIEDGVAGGVDEVGEDDGIFFGELGRGV